MRIKRTYASTIREALDLVKQEQGPDAVIMGNKKVPGGVEILSAIDFDEAAISNMAALAPAPKREPRPVASHVAAISDVASDAWAGSMSDGRKEPTLGPVAAHKPRAIVAPPSSTQRAAATVTAVNPRPRPSPQPSQARVRAAAKTLSKKAAAQMAAAQKPIKGRSSPAHPVSEKPVIDEVKIELQNLRDLMESQLSVLQWDRFSQKHPVRTVLLNLMSEMGLGVDVCETVMSHLGQLSDDPHKVWQQLLGIIARCIPVNRHDLLAEGGRIALVGSTGVGKTTTIAKLAARFVQTHGKRSVGMISTDQFRIGAQDQLQHYARLLEVPLLTAGKAEELGDRLDMLSDKKLVLIDTAGMSQRDQRLSEQFHRLQEGSPEVKPYLVLSANTQLAALNQTVLNFKKVKLAGAFVTKLDEAASLGGIITATIRHQLMLAYCGTGQKVPRDLEVAKSHRLISKAVALMQRYGEAFDQEALAARYNHIINKNQA